MMETPENNSRPKRPRLRLPFNNQKKDAGQWAYDHKVGLSITVIAYLVLSIAFVSAKIFTGSKPHTQGMYIDLGELAELEELRDQLQEEVESKQELDWSSVANRASNENSLDERVQDDRGTNTSALNEAAKAAQEEMRANREAYEKAMAEIDNIGKDRGNENTETKERRDVKVSGNVTVSYSFKNPVRHAQSLVVPAYQCQSGGEVIVAVQVDRGGKVISAKVESGGDECMRETALKASKRSTFNIDGSAPEKHRGTISYIFIPQ